MVTTAKTISPDEAARAIGQGDKYAKLREASKGKPRSAKVGRPLNPRNRLVYMEDLVASGYGSRRTIRRAIKQKLLPEPFRYMGRLAWREATIAAKLDRQQKVEGVAR